MDIWAAGCVLYYLLVGESPFERTAEAGGSLMLAIVKYVLILFLITICLLYYIDNLFTFLVRANSYIVVCSTEINFHSFLPIKIAVDNGAGQQV